MARPSPAGEGLGVHALEAEVYPSSSSPRLSEHSLIRALHATPPQPRALTLMAPTQLQGEDWGGRAFFEGVKQRLLL